MTGPIKTFTTDALRVRVYETQEQLVRAAAREVNEYLQEVLVIKHSPAAILATGNSQIQFLDHLMHLGGVDWSRITLFHMDEYLGITADHPASFRRYMRERVESRIQPKAFHYIEGDTPLPVKECERYSQLLRAQPIDLCCLGIGENGHLAFNDPPVADFADTRSVKLVKLDHDCKMQQVNEGHFPNLEAVPPYAFTLTIPALCSARKVICIAPEKRKAQAVKNALQGPMDTSCPASVLRKHAHAALLLDRDSASLL